MDQQPNFENQSLNQVQSPLPRNPYKILLFLSLGVFLIIISVLITLLISQKTSNSTQPTKSEEIELIPTEKPKTETESITPIPTEIPTISTKSTTTSSIPKDWETYTDPTYKFSISYPPEWTLEKGFYDIILNKIHEDINTAESNNWFTVKSPEGEKEGKIIKSKPPTMEGYEKPCGFYYINCYKSFELFKTELRVKENTLLSFLNSDNFSNFVQSTTDGQILYSVNDQGLMGGRNFYIQNKDTSFCYIQFCWQTASKKDLTPTEQQFVNTFKFN